jgi:hypothetical protein
MIQERTAGDVYRTGMLVHDGAHQPVPVAEVVLESARVPHSRFSHDLAKRYPVDTAGREKAFTG